SAAFLPQPQAVVENHPRAPEHPHQGQLLPWRWAEAVTVPDLHENRNYRWPMTIDGDYRRARYVVPKHDHLLVAYPPKAAMSAMENLLKGFGPAPVGAVHRLA